MCSLQFFAKAVAAEQSACGSKVGAMEGVLVRRVVREVAKGGCDQADRWLRLRVIVCDLLH